MLSARSLEASRAAGLVVVLVVAGVTVGAMFSSNVRAVRAESAAMRSPTAQQENVTLSRADMVKRGEYLVTILGCNDCHTPWIMGPGGPAPDMSRMLSGHPSDVKLTPPQKLPDGWMWAGSATNTAFFGPWGVTYAINLTPEPISGMGGVWTEEMFIRALRLGKHFGESRPILPPMPWPAFGKMSDDDLKAVWAYLQSIPPIKNEVPAHEPPPKTSTK